MLTPEQRQALMHIPEDEWVLGTYYTFSKRDLEIINKRRREENRLGFAVQLGVEGESSDFAAIYPINGNEKRL